MVWNILLQRLFGNRGSKEQAKDRLQVVLVYDRLGLSADQMEALRRDIMETISRHIAIDSERVKIDFQHKQSPAEVVINAPVRRARPAAEAPKQSAG
ncbi:MAG: cell division topological specificity factor MinE [Deltaproteobacteria bacterium]|nr:MAG: cell division topological specificity factor MinE [Deltaproteobacteria bacterium]